MGKFLGIETSFCHVSVLQSTVANTVVIILRHLHEHYRFKFSAFLRWSCV